MDGLSVLYQSTHSAPLYNIGNACGWLAKSSKAASAEYHLSGRLYLAKSGWLLLSVPNALVRGVFDAMSHAGAELPLAGTLNVPNVDKDLLNAHITVMTATELEQVGANKINERGHSFRYSLGPVKEIMPSNIDGVSKLWVIQISSPELSALRKSYGLSALPKDEPFHITVAVRRKNVLRENDISKFDNMAAADENKPTFNHPSSRGELKAAAETVPQQRVRVVLPYKGKYLLETLNNPKWPQNLGKRRFIGGGVEAGETPAQTAAREMFEELGVKIKPTAFKMLGVDPARPHEHYLELAKHKLQPGDFNATVGSDPVITLAHGDPSGDDYIGPDIKKLIAPIIQKAAADLLPGGTADNMPDSDFPKKEIALGVADEREHTNNDQIAKEIAKDHLQEDPAYYEKEKLNSVRKTPQIILQLRAAKDHSDNKRYDQKNHILRQLITAAPQDWVVDDPKPYHIGITHAPTKFRFHADPKIIPPIVPVSKAASHNPYIAQLFATAPSAIPGNTTWQNVVQHLRNVKTRGDRQAFAEQNSQGLLAELDPEYKKKLHAQIISKNYPRPDFLTRMIAQHGDSALNAVS